MCGLRGSRRVACRCSIRSSCAHDAQDLRFCDREMVGMGGVSSTPVLGLRTAREDSSTGARPSCVTDSRVKAGLVLFRVSLGFRCFTSRVRDGESAQRSISYRVRPHQRRYALVRPCFLQPSLVRGCALWLAECRHRSDNSAVTWGRYAARRKRDSMFENIRIPSGPSPFPFSASYLELEVMEGLDVQ